MSIELYLRRMDRYSVYNYLKRNSFRNYELILLKNYYLEFYDKNITLECIT